MNLTTPEEVTPSGLLSRGELLLAGAGAAGAAALGANAAAAATSGYRRLRIGRLSELRKNHAHHFNYPLQEQPNVLIDFDRPVAHGVGPRHSIVAYSILCQHMGCPVEYRANAREFYCPCHQSRYDPERLGAIINGATPRPLPRVLLKVARGAVWAVGVDGLVYGYRSNLAPGTRVGGAK